MRAAALLHQAEQQGMILRLVDGAVRMQAAAPPPADLLTALRQHRDAVADLLAQRDTADALVDAAETAALRKHYAARAGPDLVPDPMKAGLLRGFYAHRHLFPR
jgi:hypothetical protein